MHRMLLFANGTDLAAVKKKFKREYAFQKDSQGQTPLHLLCLEADPKLDIVEFLLSREADPTSKDVNGWTALLCACSSSASVELIKLLVNKGADPKETNLDGTTPLHYFARHAPPPEEMENFAKGLDFLLEHGAYINVQNKNGETPLHSAVYRGNYEMFILLLKKKADVNITNKHGESVLHYAARFCKKQIVQVLLEMGMDPLTKTGVSGTPIEVAEKESKDKEIIDLFKKKEKELIARESVSNSGGSSQNPGSSTSLMGSGAGQTSQPTGDLADNIQLKMLQKRRAWHIDYNELVVEERIGKGAFGAVYKATWRGTTVAMKKINSNQMTKKDMNTFFKEIHTISKLRHPNVILFLGACLSEPVCFITEFATRGDLYSVLHDPANIGEGSRLTWKLKLKMCIDGARGLLYLHMCSPPVVHRDLKSLNMLVDDSYNIKLTDFGISKPLENNLETMNSKMGTLNWLAPEVLDCKPYSPASDVYSYGIILWEILSQKTPFSGMHNFQILSAVAKGQGLPVPDGTDEGFARLMKDTWLVEPKDRPGMMEVLDKLLEVQKRTAPEDKAVKKTNGSGSTEDSKKEEEEKEKEKKRKEEEEKAEKAKKASNEPSVNGVGKEETETESTEGSLVKKVNGDEKPRKKKKPEKKTEDGTVRTKKKKKKKDEEDKSEDSTIRKKKKKDKGGTQVKRKDK